MNTISVVGLGYIGLPTAIVAAQSGYKVFGFDIDSEKIQKINNGDPTIVEPEIIQRLYSVLKDKKIIVSSILQESDCFIVAVPTPFLRNKNNINDVKANLSYVFDAAENIARVLKPGNLVILESTVPVGTTFKLASLLEKKSGLKLGIDIFVAHCPERVLPGKIFEELVSNDRVIGSVCDGSAKLAEKFYSKFVKGKLTFTDDKTAEMIKLVENSSRDLQIALANQISQMASRVGINPYEVISIANKHPRVNILEPGCGVGGHCIAVDPWFLIESFPQDSDLLKVARKVNDEKPFLVLQEVAQKINMFNSKNKKQPNLLILGLTFKPDIDDYRNSPALKISSELNKDNNLNLAVCEPNLVSQKIKNIGFLNVKGLLDGVKWADLILILVKHKEFFSLNELNLKGKMVIDICGLLSNKKYINNVIGESNLIKIAAKQSNWDTV
ncbi:nucleotide sugar dehydrogenase [Candidatus Dependentiae bacterium]